MKFLLWMFLHVYNFFSKLGFKISGEGRRKKQTDVHTQLSAISLV